MLDSLRSLLEDQVKDLYSAESQLLKALPKMVKRATNDELRKAFTSHLDETQGHVDRLDEVAKILEIKPGGKVCKAMKGLVEEAKEVLDEEGKDAVLDAALIAAAQRVEHYEIAAYTSALTFAEHLEEPKVMELLLATLDEETAADEKLAGIAMEEILPLTDQSTGDADEVTERVTQTKPRVASARSPRRGSTGR